MKTKLQFLAFFMLAIFTIQAQESTVNTSLGAGYSNQVYYKLSTETENSYAANSWDIAMLRTGAFSIGLRVNDGTGTEVFEASNNTADWANIDVANEANWTKLTNSDTSWAEGAFDKGSATYGFGEYNSVTHHVEGTIIFVLKYADGTYRKFINEDFFGGYTFKYSTWKPDTSTWSDDRTETISSSDNPNHTFNYFSFSTDAAVIAAPETDAWDIKFTKYYTEIPDGNGGTVDYSVTGVLINQGLEVAVNDEPDGMPTNPTLTYSSDINTIGYDWKSFSFTTGWSISSNKAYYIKYEDGTVYRLNFTDFSGSSSGDLEFKFENVTQALSIESVENNIAFSVYPNPVKSDRKINIVSDINTTSENKINIEIYNITGQRVMKTQVTNSQGFFNREIDLSSFKSGVYMLQFKSGNYSKTKRIVLK